LEEDNTFEAKAEDSEGLSMASRVRIRVWLLFDYSNHTPATFCLCGFTSFRNITSCRLRQDQGSSRPRPRPETFCARSVLKMEGSRRRPHRCCTVDSVHYIAATRAGDGDAEEL